MLKVFERIRQWAEEEKQKRAAGKRRPAVKRTMNKAPLKGMKDFLPEEIACATMCGEDIGGNRASGFERIATPILEDMENLDKQTAATT